MITQNDTSLRRVSTTTPIQDLMEIFHEAGGVIIEGFLTADQLERINHELEPALRQLDPGSKHQDEFIAEFHGRNTKRLTNLINHSKTFANEIIDNDLVHALGDAVFVEESGDWWMTTAQVIEIGPGNKAQYLHRDLENYHPFIGMGPSGPEVAVNFFIALTDFTEENGATRVIPRSNHWVDFEDRGTPEQTIPALLNAGDVLFFSGKTVHGGGANVTADNYRRALSFAFNPSFLTGEEAYPFLIDLETAKTLSPRVQKLVGFRSQYPKSSGGLWQVDYRELADYLGL
jgi:ectoine hydroxylase-related dioxygenase (phytanoyl-CoA dioxygenase family)